MVIDQSSIEINAFILDYSMSFLFYINRQMNVFLTINWSNIQIYFLLLYAKMMDVKS